MKQRAVVVMENGKMMAEVIRPEACQACHACQIGQTERMLVKVDPKKFQVGEEIELEISDGGVTMASLIAYGVPLVLFVAGLFAASRFTSVEWQQALAGILAAGAGLVCIRILEPRIKKTSKFDVQATPCHRKEQ